MRRLPFSILNYAGRKPWFLEHAERFAGKGEIESIVEPYAGSAVLSLTLVNRGYAKRAILAEADEEVRFFWKSARDDEGLADRVNEWTAAALRLPREKQRDFVIDSILRLREKDPALWLLLRSRSSYNGILTGNWPAVTRKPLESWWPATLASSLGMLHAMRDRFEVLPDAFDALSSTSHPRNYAVVDPTYTIAPESPGHNLYRVCEVNHPQLLKILAKWKGRWQLTSEFCPEIFALLKNAGLDDQSISTYVVPMRTGHGARKMELVVSREQRDLRRK